MDFTRQPWKFLQWTKQEVALVKRRGQPEATLLKIPKVYGRIPLPLADATLGKTNNPKGVDLNFHSNCALLPRNVVLRTEEELTVLPPTFLRGRMKQHGGLRRKSPEDDSYSLRIQCDAPPLKINENVYFVETDHPKVFGHVLVEALPMLWGYGYVPKGTKVATSIIMTPNYVKMFKALGVDVDSVITINRPVIPKSAYFPGLPLIRRTSIHPLSWLIFDKLGELKKESKITPPKRIYISRSKISERELVNEVEVERVFEELGFTIIHPQSHPIEDQIAMFAGAEMIAGTGGSAMHNMIFSAENVKILILASAAWLHVADILIAEKKGDLGYLFGPAFNVPKHTHKSNTPWIIDISEVKSAACEHFELNFASSVLVSK